jgi:hypothetical protein
MYHHESFTLTHDKDPKNKDKLTLTHDEDKQIRALSRKTMHESLPDIDLRLRWRSGRHLATERINNRYLLEDGSSISKGVKVLSAVSNEINCVFAPVENPTVRQKMP